MAKQTKSQQLQIRISPQEKIALKHAARQAHVSISDWVLRRLFPPSEKQFQAIISTLTNEKNKSYGLAELNDFLTRLAPFEFSNAVAQPPRVKLSVYLENYVAAMVETAAHLKQTPTPDWVSGVAPLETPFFGIDLESLRLHLLVTSPPPFRKRNIFIDSGLGDRV